MLGKTVFDRPTYPSIPALSKAGNRPFWSVMIPTYNGTAYLEQTLRSVLAQDPGEELMQIEVIDDCSTEDDPEPLVNAIGQGRITFYRQPQNQGQIKTWNVCIRRAHGEWIHILHQDDVVLPGFYEQLSAHLQDHPTAGAAFSRYAYMDEADHWQLISPIERSTPGILDHWLQQIAVEQRIQFPSIVVRRSSYEQLGGFCPEAYSAADWEMWKRISAHFPVWYEPQILACFRLHSASESSRLIRSGSNIEHTRRAIEISKAYLPQQTQQQWSKQAKQYYAAYALKTAQLLADKGQKLAAFAQIREAFICSTSPRVIRTAIEIVSQAGRAWFMDKVKAREEI
jgi:glycosyltransferase involved in cell wall biosynthesis